MRTGKVSTAVLERSVLRPVFGQKKSGEKPGTICSTVCGTWTGPFDPTPEMYFAGVYNKQLAEGRKPTFLAIDLLMPEDFPESDLKQLMKKFAELSEKKKILIAGGHTQVSEALIRPVLTLTMWSENAQENPESQAVHAQENPESQAVHAQEKSTMPLVMAGCTGWAGSALLAKAGKEKLLKRFPAVILDGCLKGTMFLFGDEIVNNAREYGAETIYALSQGGVFGGLWEMGVRDETGFETELKKIPIRQETIEVCEWYDLNPYQLYSPGAFLVTCPRGEELVERLREEGIPAEVIGNVHAGRERIIRNGEEVRYLDKPGQDMLWSASRKGERI